MSTKSLNKVMLLGNLTRDPELRYTPQGTAVCTMGLATNREWVDGSGQKQEDTQFHRLVAWGKLAEICGELLYKGRKVYVQGRLQTRSWQTQEGQDRQTTEVVLEEMIALGSPKGGDDVGYSQDDFGGEEEVFVADETPEGEAPKKTVAKKSTAKKTVSKKEDINDDIPF